MVGAHCNLPRTHLVEVLTKCKVARRDVFHVVGEKNVLVSPDFRVPVHEVVLPRCRHGQRVQVPKRGGTGAQWVRRSLETGVQSLT